MNIIHFFRKQLGLSSLPLSVKLLLLLGIVTAFLFALIAFQSQYTFGYDQARDAYEAYHIWHDHDLKVLGPGTDIPGVYHGSLWYYLLAVFYGLVGGNPIAAGYIYLISIFFTVFLTGVMANHLFRKPPITAVAMLFCAFAPLFQATTRWLSNPDLSLWVTPLLLISLWRYLTTRDSFAALFTGIGMGLLVQSNFGHGMFYVLLPVYLVAFRKLPTIKDVGLFILGSMMSLSTFILAEIKFDLRMTKSVIGFFLAPHTTSSSLITTFQAITIKYLDLFQLSVLPYPKLFICLTIILVLLSLYYYREHFKERKVILFLLIWLINIALYRFFNTGLTTSSFVFFPSLSVVIILFSYLFVFIIQNTKILFFTVLFIIISQSVVTYGYFIDKKTTLSIQHEITIQREKQIIDYTYKSAGYKPFVIATVTNPLFINTLWSYDYEFMGKPQYGYVPFFEGRDQSGFLGTLPMKKDELRIHYLIYEPTAGIPDVYISKARYTLDLYTDIVEKKNIGNFIIEKRIYHPNKEKISIPSDLEHSPILYE